MSLESPPEERTPLEREKRFHGWRLLGVLFAIVVATAIVSAIVDFAVIPR
jgi:hypothetical protein